MSFEIDHRRYVTKCSRTHFKTKVVDNQNANQLPEFSFSVKTILDRCLVFLVFLFFWLFTLITLTIFRWVLAVPATSAPSERLVSVVGNIVTVKWTRLTPIHVERLTFSHMNWERFRGDRETGNIMKERQGKIVKNKKGDNVFFRARCNSLTFFSSKNKYTKECKHEKANTPKSVSTKKRIHHRV